MRKWAQRGKGGEGSQVNGRAGADLAFLDSPSHAGSVMPGLLSCVKETKCSMTPVNMERQILQDSYQRHGDHHDGVFTVGKTAGAQLQIQHGQGAGEGSVDGNLRRGDIRGSGILTKLMQQDSGWRQSRVSRQHLPGGQWERKNPCYISRVIRHGA